MSGIFLRQSTAGQTRTIGPFVSDTDFKTAQTGLTIANTDIRIKKNGADDVAKNSGGATHDVNGCYHLTWDDTDTDTIGEFFYTVKVAGALQVFGRYTVLEEAIYDALFENSASGWHGAAGSSYVLAKDINDSDLATALSLSLIDGRIPASLSGGRMRSDVLAVNSSTLPAGNLATAFGSDFTSSYNTGLGRFNTNVSHISEDSVAADTLELFAEALDPATGQIDDGTLHATAGAEIADAVWDEPLSGHSTADTAGSDLAAAKDNTDYPDGYVYLDELIGTAGTTVGVHGTARTPANSWANASTIAVARGRKAVRNAPGGSMTIASGSFSAYEIDLNGGDLTLDDGVTLTLAYIHSSSKSGRIYETSVLNPVVVGQNCFLDNLFLNGFAPNHPQVYVTRCGLYDDVISPGAAGGIPLYMADCYNASLLGDPINFDFTLDGSIVLQGWYGDLSVSNMSAGSSLTVFGYGKLTILASCTGGTIEHTSHIEILDQASGAVTLDLISEPGSLTTAERDAIASAHLNLPNGIETGVTPKQWQQRVGAVVAGKISGAGTGTEIFVGLDGVTVRATATVDGSGNRSNWVYA